MRSSSSPLAKRKRDFGGRVLASKTFALFPSDADDTNSVSTNAAGFTAQQQYGQNVRKVAFGKNTKLRKFVEAALGF